MFKSRRNASVVLSSSRRWPEHAAREREPLQFVLRPSPMLEAGGAD